MHVVDQNAGTRRRGSHWVLVGRNHLPLNPRCGCASVLGPSLLTLLPALMEDSDARHGALHSPAPDRDEYEVRRDDRHERNGTAEHPARRSPVLRDSLPRPLEDSLEGQRAGLDPLDRPDEVERIPIPDQPLEDALD